MANLVRDPRNQNVPIDGIGVQAHLIVGEVPSTLQQDFTNLGVEVTITELNVQMTLPANSALLAQQLRDHQSWLKHAEQSPYASVSPSRTGPIRHMGIVDCSTTCMHSVHSIPGFLILSQVKVLHVSGIKCAFLLIPEDVSRDFSRTSSRNRLTRELSMVGHNGTWFINASCTLLLI